MSLINLTPHPIRVYDADGDPLFEVPPTAPPARIAMIDLGTTGHAYDEASCRSTWIDWQQFGQCHDLPQPVQGVTYIVSMIVARDQTHRADLIFPVSEVRNEQGAVIGCRGFGRVC